MVNDGNFREYKAPKQNGTKKNDGNFAVFTPGAPAPGNNGDFRTYQPDGAPEPTRAPEATRAPSAAIGAPGAGPVPVLLRSLTVSPGKKDELRRHLELTCASIAAFLLSFFDALVTEAQASPSQSAPSQAIRSAEGHEAFGFFLHDDDGAILVSGILGASPAERAGLQVGDQILTVDDGIKPTSLEHFAEAWARGAKWSAYKLMIRRSGARLPIEIAQA